jgi:hypothetical protein
VETLAQAKAFVSDGLSEGVTCPCCHQLAKAYRRTLNRTIVVPLLYAGRAAKLFRTTTPEYALTTKLWDFPRMLRREGELSGDYGKLKHWGLTIPSEDAEGKARPRAGLWQITPAGWEFMAGRLRVLKYVHLYDGKLIRRSGDLVSFREALGTRFDPADIWVPGR